MGHDEFTAAYEFLAFFLGDGFEDDSGGLLGGDAARLARVHLAVLPSVFFQGVDGDVGLHAPGSQDCYPYAVLVVLGSDGFEESVKGVFG